MTIQQLYQQEKEKIFEDFFKFLSFKSVSSEAVHKADLLACADWLVAYLKNMGFDVQLWETPGHPTIFASYMKAGPEQPTLLIYNHYDVQPVDPIAEWKSPPFEPEIRNGEIYARGAQDNKGQCFYTLQALRLLLKRDGKLPINIKLCIEGEEEDGSIGLGKIMQEHQKELMADYLAIVDVGLRSANSPSVTLGVRGMITFDLELQGSKTDLHSGCNGGLVFNPIHALVELMASLRDENGKITIPGFYDDVVSLKEEDKKQIAWDFDVPSYEKMFECKVIGGERNLPPAERNWTRPTLEINGIWGGYTGTGFKTVIPAKAFAKFSCRLVPNQEPEKMKKLIREFLEKNAPEGMKITVHAHPGGGPSVHANPSSPVVKAFSKAFEQVFNKKCDAIFEGASIPIVAKLAQISRSEIVLVGLGLADDQIHAPNEHFGVDRFEKGCLIISKAIENLKN